MARRPDDDSLPLSPRARRIGGWIAAALLIGGIALAFRILGGNGDGTVVDASPSGSTSSAAQSVTFGTALDAATGEVAAEARTERFAEGDTFVYSVTPSGSVPPTVYVEVERTDGGAADVVQEPVEGQLLPNPTVIAFTVPASILLDVFGPGRYLMTIYAEPGGSALADGSFELVAPAGSPAASPPANSPPGT